MDDNEYLPWDYLNGIELDIQPPLDGQDIFINHPDISLRLVCPGE